jgi:hypothetical protein
MNWLTMLANPKGFAIRKMMFEFLKERYGRNDQIVERLSASLTTEGDVQAFIKLMIDVYEKGYMQAVDDHKEQLAKIGLKVSVKPPS